MNNNVTLTFSDLGILISNISFFLSFFFPFDCPFILECYYRDTIIAACRGEGSLASQGHGNFQRKLQCCPQAYNQHFH